MLQRLEKNPLSDDILNHFDPATYKITFGLKENIKHIITNHQGTRMVKDGEGCHVLQMTTLKKLTHQQSQTLS